jgi:hypothetical protein
MFILIFIQYITIKTLKNQFFTGLIPDNNYYIYELECRRLTLKLYDIF